LRIWSDKLDGEKERVLKKDVEGKEGKVKIGKGK